MHSLNYLNKNYLNNYDDITMLDLIEGIPFHVFSFMMGTGNVGSLFRLGLKYCVETASLKNWGFLVITLSSNHSRSRLN